MKANSPVQNFLRELRLSRAERSAARDERRAERATHGEREDTAHSDTARKAAVEAERQRVGGAGGPLHGGF
jgi:hypothetical protein